VKKILLKWRKWLWDKCILFLHRAWQLSLGIPKQLWTWILRFAYWGKHQLDKVIDHTQREKLHLIIFESETPEGRKFDQIITWTIVLSIIIVMLETVSQFHRAYWWIFFLLEWLFTLIFTAEYILRLYAARQPLRYATSFFGIVDILAIIPSYLGIFFLGAQNLIIVRALRLLRVFRIFKMGHFVSEGEVIISALKASKTKIYVFMSFIVLMALIIGAVLYIYCGRGHQSPIGQYSKGGLLVHCNPYYRGLW